VSPIPFPPVSECRQGLSAVATVSVTVRANPAAIPSAPPAAAAVVAISATAIEPATTTSDKRATASSSGKSTAAASAASTAPVTASFCGRCTCERCYADGPDSHQGIDANDSGRSQATSPYLASCSHFSHVYFSLTSARVTVALSLIGSSTQLFEDSSNSDSKLTEQNIKARQPEYASAEGTVVSTQCPYFGATDCGPAGALDFFGLIFGVGVAADGG
jgi:hypothetical protein